MVSIYVGNLSYGSTEADIRNLFTVHGRVNRVNVMIDKVTGRPRVFAFVEMASDTEAQAAIDALNDTEVAGRRIVVNEARPREYNAR